MKGGIVVGKDGYAQRCRGRNCVRVVAPQYVVERAHLAIFCPPSQPAGRLWCSASALPGAVMLGAATSVSTACQCRWCVERSDVSLMSSTLCHWCVGARWSWRGTTGPAACRQCACRCPQPGRRSRCRISARSALGSTTSGTTAAMHLPGCFHLGFFTLGCDAMRWLLAVCIILRYIYVKLLNRMAQTTGR